MAKAKKMKRMKTWKGWVLINDDGHMSTYVLQEKIKDRPLLDGQRWVCVAVCEPQKARRK